MQKIQSRKSIDIFTVLLVILVIISLSLCMIIIVMPKLIEQKEGEVVKNNSKINHSYSTTEENIWDISAVDGVSNVTATLSKDGLLTISGTGSMIEWESFSSRPWDNICYKIKQVIIEEGINNIGSCTFQYCYNLTNVKISNTIKTIGASGFEGCYGLTSIDIPEGVTSIGFCTFMDCVNLISIKIPSTVTNIDNDVFYCYNLKQINVNAGNTTYCDVDGVLYTADKTEILRYPMGREENKYTILNTVKKIGISAFEGCYMLKSVDIPESVTSIDSYAFYGCEGLTNIEVPSSVTYIGYETFNYCRINKFVMTEENKIDLPNILKRAQKEEDILYSSEGFSIKNGIIEDEKIKINDGETYATIEVKEGLLEGLTFIVSYNIWDVSENNDKSLMATLDENGLFTIYGIGDMKDFQNLPWYELKNLIRNLKIDEGVSSVNLYEFNYCYNLENVEISNSIVNLGEDEYYILYECWMLKNIIVNSNNTKYIDDNGVLYTKDSTKIIKYPAGRIQNEYKILNTTQKINEVAFESCWLESIEIPNTVTEIGQYAFSYCWPLKNIKIPEGVQDIKAGAFYCCEELTTIIIPKSVLNISENILKYSDLAKIYCYVGSYAEKYAKENDIPYEIIYLFSTDQKIDEINLKITNIKPNTTVEQIRETLKSDISYQIKNIEGNIIEETSNVGTGYKLELENGDVYTLIVTGDLNGDGQVKPSDLSKLKLNLVGSQTLQGAYAEAADLNGDGQIKPSDLSKLKLYLVGKVGL